VNLIGEHTDYNEGFVLPLALNRATCCAVRRRDDSRVRMASTGGFVAVDAELDHMGPGQVQGWAAYPLGVLWALRQQGHTVPGLNVLFDSTVPAGAGLSSSAALTCSIATAVNELADLGLDRAALAAAARRAENEVAGAPTGPMDQLASLHGQRGCAVFIDCRDLTVTPIPLGLTSASLTVLVIDTRTTHLLNDGAYAQRRTSCEAAAQTLGVPALRDASLAELHAAGSALDATTMRRARHIITENTRVCAVVALLRAGDVADIGPQLTASHVSLRDDFEVSCPELNTVVDAANAAGALGARMTGGGFGGSAIALVPTAAAEQVSRAVHERCAAAGQRPPRIFPAHPSAGAHRMR